MRHSTQEENDDYEAMLDRKSVVLVSGKVFARLKAENATLREMVAALWKCCAWETDSEGWCEECNHHDTEEGGCRLKSLARELGIEVDG